MAANTHSIDLERGSSQYLSAADSASLSITGNLTLEMWVNIESQPSASVYTFASKYDGAGNQRSYLFNYEDSGGTKRFAIVTSANGTAVGSGTLNYTLSNATWYHLAFVYTAASSSCEIFVTTQTVDTVSVGTITGLTSALFDSTASFFLGRDDGTAYFDGLIDDVRLWSTARTITEISENCMTEIDSATGLQGSWHLNNSLADSSGNANTLTNNGAASFSTSQHPITLRPPATVITTSHPALSSNVSQTVVVPVSSIQVTHPALVATQVDGKWTNTNKSSTSWTNVDKT